MSLLFDHDAVTGVTQYFDYDPVNDNFSITSVQDVKPLLDHLQELRNNPNYSQRGIKHDWWHYATIPSVVEMELKKKGIDIYNKHQTKEIIKEINMNYPWLRATDKRHA